ncbi:MAG: DEAD/DEAH box helicase [Candidatus Woesebacteria bacterium]
MSYNARPQSRGYSSRPSYGGGYNSRPSSGGRSSFGSRGPRSQGGPRPKYIHPSLYVNHATERPEVAPTPITNTFADFNLHAQLMSNITKHGYTEPTPIQDQAIPAAMLGKDVVGLANTGTGKTAAFLLPILHRIANNPQEGALIVVPTRELAVQVEEECRSLSRGLPVGMVLCVGGLSVSAQMQSLSRNPHIVIGTPGRLKDLIERRSLKPELFTTIVLDEVDRMLDIGFRKDIQYLISLLPKERHSLCFSATITKDVEEIMRTFLQDPVRISVKVTETNEHIDQDVIRVPPGGNKIDVLTQLLLSQDCERAIVFGRTKHGISKLEEILLDRGLRVTSIHGNKTQGARQRSLEDFKRGRVKALLATDVAARGLDINDVTHVINYDEPNSYEDYIHRIGRTGRAGKVGKALTFVA